MILGPFFRHARLLNLVDVDAKSLLSRRSIGVSEHLLVPYDLGWKWQMNLAEEVINSQTLEVIVNFFITVEGAKCRCVCVFNRLVMG